VPPGSNATGHSTLTHQAGGAGRHHGGDGCVRDIEFTEELDVAIISQRRVIAPYGMAGGEPGKVGANFWLKKRVREGSTSHTKINLGPSNQTRMRDGDHVIIRMFKDQTFAD
jgi:5-oxoprolinase (ATP-hydrolysing)